MGDVILRLLRFDFMRGTCNDVRMAQSLTLIVLRLNVVMAIVAIQTVTCNTKIAH